MSSVTRIPQVGPTGLFDDDLMNRLHERETQIGQGQGIKAKDVKELVAKLSPIPVPAL